MPEEILQIRSPLKNSSGLWGGELKLRITKDAYRERAEYWVSPGDFVSTSDKLSHEVMQSVLGALADLAASAKGYDPEIDANDSGRSIIFWNGQNPVTVFIPSNPVAYQPSATCISAFDRLWSIVTKTS